VDKMEWDGMVVIQLQHVSDAGFRLKCAKKDLPLTMHLHLHLQHSRAYLLIILATHTHQKRLSNFFAPSVTHNFIRRIRRCFGVSGGDWHCYPT